MDVAERRSPAQGTLPTACKHSQAGHKRLPQQTDGEWVVNSAGRGHVYCQKKNEMARQAVICQNLAHLRLYQIDDATGAEKKSWALAAVDPDSSGQGYCRESSRCTRGVWP